MPLPLQRLLLLRPPLVRLLLPRLLPHLLQGRMIVARAGGLRARIREASQRSVCTCVNARYAAAKIGACAGQSAVLHGGALLRVALHGKDVKLPILPR